ncbi:MAG TPA: DUF4835 family protein [Candidatus Kapabacteria bacterium]|nr:DUF4835 family protein [Candidatus Kapabacteria bacterium]
MKKIIIILLGFLPVLFCNTSAAQEIVANVVIDARPLSSTDRTALSGITQALQNYINSYNWTGGSWTLPKVNVSLQISFTQSLGGGTYDAQLLVVSSRPIGNSDQTTTVLRVVDNSWEFNYSPNQPLEHLPGVFNSLTSMIDCYAYIALGYTADTYVELGGTPFYRNAWDICQQGQSSGTPQGWTESDGSAYTRYSFVRELLDPRFETLRHLIYSYYRNGLDIVATQADNGNRTMLNVVDSLYLFKNNISGPSITLDRFLDAKYLELAQFFADFPDKGSIYDELETIDPSHQTYYEEYRNK